MGDIDKIVLSLYTFEAFQSINKSLFCLSSLWQYVDRIGFKPSFKKSQNTLKGKKERRMVIADAMSVLTANPNSFLGTLTIRETGRWCNRPWRGWVCEEYFIITDSPSTSRTKSIIGTSSWKSPATCISRNLCWNVTYSHLVRKILFMQCLF